VERSATNAVASGVRVALGNGEASEGAAGGELCGPAGGRKEAAAEKEEIASREGAAGVGAVGRGWGSQLCSAEWVSPPPASVSRPLEMWKTCNGRTPLTIQAPQFVKSGPAVWILYRFHQLTCGALLVHQMRGTTKQTVLGLLGW